MSSEECENGLSVRTNSNHEKPMVSALFWTPVGQLLTTRRNTLQNGSASCIDKRILNLRRGNDVLKLAFARAWNIGLEKPGHFRIATFLQGLKKLRVLRRRGMRVGAPAQKHADGLGIRGYYDPHQRRDCSVETF